MQGWRARTAFNPLTRAGAWRVLGVGTIVAGAMCPLFMRQERRASVVWSLAASAFASTFLASACFVRAKRHESHPRTALDDRPPVLYLRPFRDDASVARHLGLASFAFRSEEEELADILHAVGPLVAVGRPGEALSYPGASRTYFDEGEWQSRVHSMLKMAALGVGETSGVWWELQRAVEHVPPDRLVLLLPFTRHRYEQFKHRAATLGSAMSRFARM